MKVKIAKESTARTALIVNEYTACMRFLGGQGIPFPLVSGIAAETKYDDCKLLIHAFLRRTIPATYYNELHALAELILHMAMDWQEGAKEVNVNV